MKVFPGLRMSFGMGDDALDTKMVRRLFPFKAELGLRNPPKQILSPT